VAAALLIAMALGSLALWTAVPIGGLWFAASVATSAAGVYVVALCVCPTVMLAWGLLLAQVSRLYISVRSRDGIEARSPLEALLVGSFAFAVLAFLVWYFAFSGTPTSTPWPDEFSGQ
jgi:hypothetical protein